MQFCQALQATACDKYVCTCRIFQQEHNSHRQYKPWQDIYVVTVCVLSTLLCSLPLCSAGPSQKFGVSRCLRIMFSVVLLHLRTRNQMLCNTDMSLAAPRLSHEYVVILYCMLC